MVTKDELFSRKSHSERSIGPVDVQYCRQKLTWTVRNNWCKVIFSDETKVVIGADKKMYVWRRCNERLYPECT